MKPRRSFRPIVRSLWLALVLGIAGCASGGSSPPAASKGEVSGSVGAERPTYKLGDRWIRSDGIYELVRLEDGHYVFSAGPHDEIELTKDLMPVRIGVGAGIRFQFIPPPALVWPLEVGRRGSGVGTFKPNYHPSYPASITWVVEAYEDVEVPAGKFKAYRVAFKIDPIVSTNFGRGASWALAPGPTTLHLWYAPDAQRFVKSDSRNAIYLHFDLVALDPEETAPIRIGLHEPKDQAQFGDSGETTVSGNVAGGKGVAEVSVSLNGEVVSREQSGRAGKKAVIVNTPIKLRDGKNVLLVTATDPAGASTQEARTIFYEAPLRLTLPAPGQVVRTPRRQVVLGGRVPLPAGGPITWYRLVVNGNLAVIGMEVARGAKEIELDKLLTLSDGENRVALEFVGGGTTEKNLEWTVIFDPAAPATAIAVSTLESGSSPSKRAPPSSPAPLPPPAASPPASPAVATSPSAPAGSVVVATVAPLRVDLSTPPDQSRFEQETMALAGLVSAGKGVSRISIALNGGEISSQEERPAQRTVPVSLGVKLREGQNTLVVTARDTDGTVSQEVRTVYYERPAPLSIAFRYPQDMARVTDLATVAAAVITSSRGVAKVSVTLNGVEVHGQTERTLQKSVLVTTPLKLRDGVNTIGITASEPDGTVRQEVRTMIYEALKVAAPPPAPPPVLPIPDRWAVVIGVGNYESPGIPKLRYTVSDAEAIYQVLIGPAGFKKERVLLLTDSTERKPTVRNIRWALGTFLSRSAKKDDTVLIFFAGHGAPETDPRGLERDGLAKYLIPSDADPDDLYSSALPMDELQTVFGRIEAERVVAFLDACYSGAAGGRTFGSQRTRSGSVDDLFLERLTRSKGRVIITASRPTELSVELSEFGHGIFTYYLIQGLKGAADLNRDGIVTLQELYGYVEQQVSVKSRSVGGNQHPVMKGEMEGSLPLIRIEAR